MVGDAPAARARPLQSGGRRTDLREVAAATLRALARQPRLRVEFGAGTRVSGLDVRLPLPQPVATGVQRAVLRGEVDAIGLRLRHHDPALQRELAPRAAAAMRLFDELEQARCEACGARRLPGTAVNIAAARRQRARSDSAAGSADADVERLTETLGLLARRAFGGAPAAPAAGERLEALAGQLEARIGAALLELAEAIDDQRRFGEKARELVLCLDAAEAVETSTAGEDGDGDDRPGQQAREADDADRTAQPGAPADLGLARAERDGDSLGRVRAAGAESADDGLIGRLGAGRSDGSEEQYRAFTVEFDAVVDAGRLCPPAEIARLRAELDRQLEAVPPLASRLAQRLQRRLLAQCERVWEFDLDDGTIDAARLTRIVTSPFDPLLHKREREAGFADTVVSLLIDNSGSMRGRSIRLAAMSAEIIARALERCGVKVEILGFTTRAWKGGRSRSSWVAAGMPPAPGRLNELLHIVYKAADQPWRRARRNLGVMLLEGLLKENIDGEALWWAHERLLVRPEQRRILMVVSDGGPLDDATLAANPGGYLERHLRRVIHYIETRSPVELVAIGIGHDVTRQYRRSTTISEAGELGGVMIARLADLLGDGLHRRAAVPGRRLLTSRSALL